MRCRLMLVTGTLFLGSPWDSASAPVPPLAGEIAGRVVLASDTTLKIAGARVSIPATAFRTTTDSIGAFAFQDVPNGRYRIEVSYETYPGVAALETAQTADGSGRTVTIGWEPSGAREPAAVADAVTRLASVATQPPPTPDRSRIRLSQMGGAANPSPLTVVDDVLYIWPTQQTRSDINVDQILSVQVVKANSTRTGRSAIQRYGVLGIQGAIVIATTAATPR